ncbi:MAG: putative signal transduction protein with domain [Dactylosporangium sp.]|jgi:CBS domain-containing protein|nr:putative signal transduction protein with domain [Dactylosporangium sp.]
MQVRDAMSKAVLTVGPEHTLRQTARLMSSRKTGSAVVIDPDGAGVGIITERDVLNALAAGLDPDVEHAASHITWDVVYAGPSWTLEEAAAAMIRGGFRHLVVVSDDEVLGVISVRDVVRVWTQNRSAVPA